MSLSSKTQVYLLAVAEVSFEEPCSIWIMKVHCHSSYHAYNIAASASCATLMNIFDVLSMIDRTRSFLTYLMCRSKGYYKRISTLLQQVSNQHEAQCRQPDPFEDDNLLHQNLMRYLHTYCLMLIKARGLINKKKRNCKKLRT
jgi:hypothetical protein